MASPPPLQPLCQVTSEPVAALANPNFWFSFAPLRHSHSLTLTLNPNPNPVMTHLLVDYILAVCKQAWT
jgi:hypothetical protein